MEFGCSYQMLVVVSRDVKLNSGRKIPLTVNFTMLGLSGIMLNVMAAHLNAF
jgi:hypothetical protein